MGNCNQKDVAVTCMMSLMLAVRCVVDVHACILYDLTEFLVQPSVVPLSPLSLQESHYLAQANIALRLFLPPLPEYWD